MISSHRNDGDEEHPRPRYCQRFDKHFVDKADDVVSVHALRTPLRKAYKGGFKVNVL